MEEGNNKSTFDLENLKIDRCLFLYKMVNLKGKLKANLLLKRLINLIKQNHQDRDIKEKKSQEIIKHSIERVEQDMKECTFIPESKE